MVVACPSLCSLSIALHRLRTSNSIPDITTPRFPFLSSLEWEFPMCLFQEVPILPRPDAESHILTWGLMRRSALPEKTDRAILRVVIAERKRQVARVES